MDILVEQITQELGRNKIEVNNLKKIEEMNRLENLKENYNPLRIYDANNKENFIEFDKNEKVLNKVGNQNQMFERNVANSGKKKPKYQKGAKIDIPKNIDSEKRAGGYNIDNIYKEMYNYALHGFD